jgi:hypothetical protein
MFDYLLLHETVKWNDICACQLEQSIFTKPNLISMQFPQGKSEYINTVLADKD